LVMAQTIPSSDQAEKATAKSDVIRVLMPAGTSSEALFPRVVQPWSRRLQVNEIPSE